MTWRLTKTGNTLLGVLVLFYLAALTSQSSLLLFLDGILLSCYALNTLQAWRILKHIELEPPKSAHLLEGQAMTQPWRVINRGRRRAGFLSAETDSGCLFRVVSLPSGKEASLLPNPVYQRRGVFRHSQIKLSCLFPFGLVQMATRLSLPGEVVVGPAVYDTASPRVAGFATMVGGKQKGRHRSLSGAEFAGVRPMQPGDPMNSVHWRSSAKGQGWMVKTFDQELAGRASFVVDGGHRGDAKALDDCLRAAGSLMLAVLAEGHHVEWIDLSHLQIQRIPPTDDGHALLDALARLELSPGCLSQSRLDVALGSLSTRSAIHFVLTECPDFVGQAANQLSDRHRNVSLYLPEGCRAPSLEGVPLHHYAEHRLAEHG